MTIVGSPKPGCELCEAVPFTRQYAADAICWAAECESCSVPMVVWRTHGIDPDDAALAHMLVVLTAAAEECFGANARWFIDRQMRQIPDHFHAHARPDRWSVPPSSQPVSRRSPRPT